MPKKPVGPDPYAATAIQQPDPYAATAIQAPAAPPATSTAPEGFFGSLADASGLSSVGSAIAHPIKTLAPVVGLASDVIHGRPANDTNPIVQGVQGMVKNTVGEGKEAVAAAKQGSYGAAAAHAIQSIPVLGSAMQKAAAQGPGDTGSYLHNLKGLVASPGAMGTLVGTAGTLAVPAMKNIAKLPGAASALDTAASAVPDVIANPINSIPQLPATILQKAGSGMQTAGEGLINQTVGAKKGSFARGASPGSGYFQAGFGPSASMGSIAAKSADALDTTGKAIGAQSKTFQAGGGLIPYEAGSGPIQTAIAKTRDALLSPGGTGNAGAVDGYASTWQPMLQAAEERGGFLPEEYAAAKHNTGKNTTWGDPAQAGMKDLRQQTVGGMGGQMVNAMPDLGPLNSRYQNLYQLNKVAEERALTGSKPLTSLMTKGGLGLAGATGGLLHSPTLAGAGLVGGALLDSIPAKTAAASALFYGGKGLSKAGAGLSKILPLAPRVP